MEFVIWLIVTALSFILISYLPIGVEVDSFPKALIAALVFGVVNALLKPILTGFGLFSLLTLGLASLVANVVIFGLTAALVQGFRLRSGVLSAIIGAIALSLVNSLLFQILGQIFPALTR
jgi:putative membrane protein